jgi:hypothetical protein
MAQLAGECGKTGEAAECRLAQPALAEVAASRIVPCSVILEIFQKPQIPQHMRVVANGASVKGQLIGFDRLRSFGHVLRIFFSPVPKPDHGFKQR